MSKRMTYAEWVHYNEPYFGEESTKAAWDYQEKHIAELEARIEAARGCHQHQPPMAPKGSMVMWAEDVLKALEGE